LTRAVAGDQASAPPIWVATRKVSTGTLRVIAAVSGLEPR
jgi:hypothetical protein